MPLNDALLNVGANAMAAEAAYLALHDLPDATGSNESTAPRVPAGWSAVGGDLVITDKSFTGGAPNGPCTHAGLWSTLAAGTGTYYGSVALTGDLTFDAAGKFTIMSLTVNGFSK